ncbi:ATP-dependent helicase HrpB [Telmatospirillum sp. J64-1]|uniref:ATP-dependent helicase HrpB n=1 Tax=Telmatospirillum sp. J64-1 TaxID=2502183 RepID=UPI0021064DB5|nr:ATP-dependent helicase HrpB [Telmatospirillum sp. J64-1]
MISPLPIDEALPALLAALKDDPRAVLQAPPGAGKTTRVPLALLDQDWAEGRRILMLEPRRLAARAAAARMAQTLGEAVGETIGYRIRLDSRVSGRTRIEVVTEGILTRMIQDDPALDGVAAVIFDEFHERSLNADLGLALALEAQALREDLRILVMSATLDGEAVAALLGDAPIVTSQGRAFPVETRHLDPQPKNRIEEEVAAAIRRALAEESGSILVFLPGQGEIRRVQSLLGDLGEDVLVAPLYGDLPQAAQDAAIRPCPQGRRKVVLSTAIAETSLTIEGIRVVIDSGLMRVPRFEPASGMTRLVTVKVSKASAEQRRGRAGRMEPGVCYRLWPEAAHGALAAQSTPEILEADLAPLALDLAQWGVTDPRQLAWLDAPPTAAWSQACDLLRRLGALDAEGRITRHGQVMARLPLHPRLAHMILAAKELGLGGLACEVAAILSERDLLRGQRDADLRRRIEVLRGAERGLEVDRGAVQRARQSIRQWQRQLDIKEGEGGIEETGLVLAFAYPDRIGQRRSGAGRQYRLSNGRGAFFSDQGERLAAEDFIVCAELDGDKREARIFLAAPVTRAELETHFADAIEAVDEVAWDSREQAVQARRRRKLGALVLKDEPLGGNADSQAAISAMCEGIRELGLNVLPWTKELENWRGRVMFLRRVEGESWPDLSDQALLDGLEDWLGPFLTGITRRGHLAKLDLAAALHALLDWPQSQALDKLAPSHLTVPSGSRIPLDYAGGETPVLAVRLQEMFGATETPALAGGKVPLVVHLLSPAHRPVQVTQDLAGFWKSSYHAVKADLKGRYPKHYWPDDPLQAQATSRAKPRGQ